MKNLNRKPAALATGTALQGNHILTKEVTKGSGYTVGRMGRGTSEANST